MSQPQSNPEATTQPELPANAPSVVDAVFDAALAWAAVGLAHVKTSLDATARAMDRTAKALDVVREKIQA
jgi:hypothetical protein